MFERRVKLLLVLFALPAMAVAARLVHLQLLNASVYQQATKDMLELPPRQFPCLRGSILDSRGRRLAYDAPAWDIAVQYGVLDRTMLNDASFRKRLCGRIGITPGELTSERIAASWARIAQLSEKSPAELQSEADLVIKRVRRIKQRVCEQRGVETLIQEELEPHAVVTGLDQAQQVAARVGLAEFPWVQVVSSHTRRYEGGSAIGHLIGRVIRVTDELMANDPNADDPLASYSPEEVFGVRGVEALCETWLRGRRGQTHMDRLGHDLSPPIEAQDGKDVHLTIDLELQQALYARLGAEISTRFPTSPGGCAVVLDIPTRSVIAMVSYPSVDPNNPPDPSEIKPEDEIRRPYLFRAVREHYNPGSIVKPMLLAAGLTDGTVTPSSTVTCIGHYFANDPNQLRCTAAHGVVDPIMAIQHSCNIFFYHLGEKMGVTREAWWMHQFGLGQLSGIGLLDEIPGGVPTTRSKGEARQSGIGQGQTEVTPLQAANMIATVASGEYRPVTVWANDPRPRPATRLKIDESAWRTAREGMYRVVNRQGGTAFHHAVLSAPGDYVLLGKTGSAESGWYPEYIYTCRSADGKLHEIRCTPAFFRKYAPEHGLKYVSRADPPGYEKTHGWFVGYLAPRDHYLDDVTSGRMGIAIAVVVEYAGHGGVVAGPIAAQMLDSIVMARNGGGS